MPKSTENTDPDTPMSLNMVEAMRRSWANGAAIRVIRGKGAGWAGRPCVGLRYDGLYEIVDEEMHKNAKGGCYVRFKLERKEGQVPLDALTMRPRAQEVRDEERVKEGY